MKTKLTISDTLKKTLISTIEQTIFDFSIGIKANIYELLSLNTNKFKIKVWFDVKLDPNFLISNNDDYKNSVISSIFVNILVIYNTIPKEKITFTTKLWDFNQFDFEKIITKIFKEHSNQADFRNILNINGNRLLQNFLKKEKLAIEKFGKGKIELIHLNNNQKINELEKDDENDAQKETKRFNCNHCFQKMTETQKRNKEFLCENCLGWYHKNCAKIFECGECCSKFCSVCIELEEPKWDFDNEKCMSCYD